MAINPQALAESILHVISEAEAESEAHLLPGVPREDGVILAALAFTAAAIGGEIAADIGAGAGVSSAWIAYGFSRGCGTRTCTLHLVDIDESVLRLAERNARRLASGPLRVEARRMRATDYLSSVASLDFAFVDVAKECYPRVLRLLRDKLSGRGIAVFHNALYPPPPREFYEELEREWRWALIPTRLGIVIAARG